MALDRTGNGYLVDPSIWSEEIMHEMATEDDITLSDSQVNQIRVAREYFSENSSVPPIRTFAKVVGVDKKNSFQRVANRPYEANHEVWRNAPTNRLRLKILVTDKLKKNPRKRVFYYLIFTTIFLWPLY